MGVIEGYASATSVSQGQDVAFHVYDEAGSFTYEIRRLGAQEPVVATGAAKARAYETPANAYEVGCGWPAAFTITVPESWKSGVYVARLSSAAGTSRDIAFVVKSRRPGERARILLALPVTTGQAYNGWGGKSLYPFNSTEGIPATHVSFDRPTDELITRREVFFLRWLEENDYDFDCCTSLDLHADPELLSRYQLLVSVGHDEYWSRAMRDNVEAFVARGGNVAFFSGNVCYWQVRFEHAGRTMVCYKSSERDPITPADPSQTTVRWASEPVSRPENLLTGVGFRNGAGWWETSVGPRPAADYTVHFAEHWIFTGSNLKSGGKFGGDKLIIGYETDAAKFTMVNGVPEVTGTDGTPRNFVILASADLTSWGPGGQAGYATLGLYRNRGVVFTAATVDWVKGLVPPVDAVQIVTANVLSRLSRPGAASPPIENADLTRFAGDVPVGWERAGTGKTRPAAALFDGQGAVLLDATEGEVALGQALELLEWRSDYRITCWVKASGPGATVQLVSARSSKVVAAAEHSGSGQWEQLTAIGRLDSEGPLFPARIELRLSAGTATFSRIAVEAS